MDPREFLAVFAQFERVDVDYVIVGKLAQTLRCELALSECIEIAIDERSVEVAVAIMSRVWTRAESSVMSADAITRFLPPQSPMYVDLLPMPLPAVVAETVYCEGIALRFADSGDRDTDDAIWTRPGFTLRERLDILNTLTAALLPSPRPTGGVRKYRSYEALVDDRNERARERFGRSQRHLH